VALRAIAATLNSRAAVMEPPALAEQTAGGDAPLIDRARLAVLVDAAQRSTSVGFQPLPLPRAQSVGEVTLPLPPQQPQASALALPQPQPQPPPQPQRHARR
jgi:hypothetical protein